MVGPRKNKQNAQSKEEINIAKLERKNILEQQRRIKPGECLKYIRCVIDPEFLNGAGRELLETLNQLNIKYIVQPQLIPRTIIWERLEQQKLFENSNEIISEKYQKENQVLHLIYCEEFMQALEKNTLSNLVTNIQNNYPDLTITILMFGLKRFANKSNNQLEWSRIEIALTELQIVHKCYYRLYESSAEVANNIGYFTKAIAEIPYKKEQSDKYTDINLFLLNDNKDCVRVEGFAGLNRLWQQHLTILPLVTLETAEAVTSKYPQPKKLIEEYENEFEDGPKLLADLKVQRRGGPLQSNRRIGPELSRKIHTLYTSENPNEIL